MGQLNGEQWEELLGIQLCGFFPWVGKVTASHHAVIEKGPRMTTATVCLESGCHMGGNIPCSVQFSHSVMSDCLQPHELQHTRPPCPSPTPGVYPNSCPLSRWCHPTISSSVIPFSSCSQSFPTSRSFPVSQLFASGGPSIGVSASTSVLPMNTQDWFPLDPFKIPLVVNVSVLCVF